VDQFLSLAIHDADVHLAGVKVGNVGLYYCCYKLSLMGWNVMPTARNARGVDLIAYSGDASRFLGVQVKCLSKRNPVPLGTTLGKCMGDFWVIINRVASSPTAFVLLPAEVKERAHRAEKDGRVSFWLEPADYDQAEFREAWVRIGYGGIDAQPAPPNGGPAASVDNPNAPDGPPSVS
jgi:hypothetical protein